MKQRKILKKADGQMATVCLPKLYFDKWRYDGKTVCRIFFLLQQLTSNGIICSETIK